jgi:hypothetical protein
MRTLLKSSYRDCHCAFCHKPRKVFVKRHMTWTDVVIFAVMAMTLSGLVWQRLDPRAIFLFVGLLVIGESVIQVRWRLGLACSGCGFDPLLYARRPDAARARVRRFYERRSQQPDFLLTAHSLIETQRRYQKRDHALRKRHPQLDQQGALAPQVRNRTSSDVKDIGNNPHLQ